MNLLGDCLELLKELGDNSVDSLITDPPAGISFMGKGWDSDKGGRNQWIIWMTQVMSECLRVLKPGAHGLVWALPRTSHWTATALEDAGFEVRDVVTHLFGSGFPKSMDISKAIDKAAGAVREVIGKSNRHTSHGNKFGDGNFADSDHCFVTAPSTPEAKQWQGWGTALKPASEHWILVRKPCSEKTVAESVLKHGVGGLNIDVSRIGVDGRGRFPANLVFSHNPDCVQVGMKKVGSGDRKQSGERKLRGNPVYGAPTTTRHSPDNYGTETVAAFECIEGCAVAMLDAQSGSRPSGAMKNIKSESLGYHGKGSGAVWNHEASSGGASRFYYCAKASKKDKGADNTHPTVKSSTLMSYLINLITPPNGIVLDPFMGSGSTGVAAIKSGFQFCGIENSQEYYQIAQARIGAAN